MTAVSPSSADTCSDVILPRSRRVPAIGSPAARRILGVVATIAAPMFAARLLVLDAPSWLAVAFTMLVVWLPATWITDKYVHKYPYRYVSYLLASHGKSATIAMLLFAALALLVPAVSGPWQSLAAGLVMAAVVDLLVALPSVERAAPKRATTPAAQAAAAEPVPDVNPMPGLATIRPGLDADLCALLDSTLPSAGAALPGKAIGDREELAAAAPESLGLLVGTRPLNAVRRLNLYLQDCAAHVAMGGYLALRYTPLDQVLDRLRERYAGALYPFAYLAHFVWYRAIPKLPWLDVLYFSKPFAFLDHLLYRPGRGRNRVISRSEVWGRLAFYGFEVVREDRAEGGCVLVARRTGRPVKNRKPSYYAVVALEKVGLDGEVVRLLKVRSMFPFSEFLQKKIFESHGLTATGKFKNDFRLTEYGPLIRSSWIDELPGIYNWLRGDVKLVGMRATSPHFLGLYPPSVYDRYILVKPGLVPPIFDEKTAGFEQIVEVESTYLRRYLAAPVRTDIAYFWYTFRDIVFRRVRSH